MNNTKNKRIVVAALLGCATMFIWGGFSHLVLFVGTGFKPLPNEDKIIEVLQNSINEQGLYFFPGKDFRHSSPEQESEWEKKFRSGSVGLLVYRPIGGNPFSPEKLITQFVSNLISVLIVILITSLILANYWKRVLVITLLGGLASVAVGTIYWNWYEFPTSFFLAQIIDIQIGFFLAGLIIAKYVPQPNIEQTK